MWACLANSAAAAVPWQKSAAAMRGVRPPRFPLSALAPAPSSSSTHSWCPRRAADSSGVSLHGQAGGRFAEQGWEEGGSRIPHARSAAQHGWERSRLLLAWMLREGSWA